MSTVQIAKEPKIIVPNQVVQLRKQDGKRIIQMWLADSSFTFNGRRLNKDALPNIVKTVIGQKYIIPPSLEHPQRDQKYPNDLNRDLQSIADAAKPYEAGTVYDLERQNRYGIEGYDAFINLDTEIGKNLFDSGMIPRYSSTSLYKLDSNEPEDNITKALINNICAVKYPNYGIKASLVGMCVGDGEDCKEQLLNNSAPDPSKPCPTMKAVSELDDENKIVFDNTVFIDKELQSSDNSMSANTATATAATANPNLGTTDATVVYEFPKSGRKIVLDGKGKIINDSHPKDEVPQEVKKLTTSNIETEKPEGNGNGNGDNKPAGGDDNAKSSQAGNEEKTTEKTEKKEEVKTETKEEKKEEANLNNDNNTPQAPTPDPRVQDLEKEVGRYKEDRDYWRSRQIREKVSKADYLKKEEKDDHIKNWEKMAKEVSAEALDFALNTAYSPVRVEQKVSADKERKNSAYDADAEYQNSDSNEKHPKAKLTYEMLKKGR